VQISTFIFDLDGTLSDPLQGMADSINYALRTHGFAERELSTIAQFVGPPLEGTLAELTGSDENQLIDALVVSYRERYLQTGYAQNSVYQGIPDMLEKLKTNGQRMGICTSKPATTAEKILRLFNLDHYFSFISGGDIGVKKAQQLSALLAEGVIDLDSLMIGDRSVDIVAAQSNNLKSAAVMWGYGSRAELNSAAPTVYFETPQDVTNDTP